MNLSLFFTFFGVHIVGCDVIPLLGEMSAKLTKGYWQSRNSAHRSNIYIIRNILFWNAEVVIPYKMVQSLGRTFCRPYFSAGVVSHLQHQIVGANALSSARKVICNLCPPNTCNLILLFFYINSDLSKVSSHFAASSQTDFSVSPSNGLSSPESFTRSVNFFVPAKPTSFL